MKRTTGRRTVKESAADEDIQGAESERAPRRLSSLLDEKAVAEAVTRFKTDEAAQTKNTEPSRPFSTATIISRLWSLRFLLLILLVAPSSVYVSNKISPETENIVSTILALLLLYDLFRDVFQQSKAFATAKICHIAALSLVLFGLLLWAVYAQFGTLQESQNILISLRYVIFYTLADFWLFGASWPIFTQ
jgi:hypothetical protein